MNYQHNGPFKNSQFSRQQAKSNPLQFAKVPDFKLGQHDQGQIQQNYEETMTKPLVPSKMRISLDDEATMKIGWQKEFKSGQKASLPKNQLCKTQLQQKIHQKDEDIHTPLIISANPKVQEILSKKPLRQRFSGLLPLQLQLPISFDHQQILKRMDLIDINMDFLGTSRNSKILFFDAIRKSIYKNTSIVVELKHIQQLLFLDENCYIVEWKMNDKIKKFDLKIALPRINSMDMRRMEMRKNIVKFLISKEAEFLGDKKLTKIDNHKWDELFDYKKVKIPQKALPIHPNSVSSEIRALADNEIEKVENSALKNLFKSKKKQSDVKSISSVSVADMIFSKVSAGQISNQILEMIKQKEKKNMQEQKVRQVQNSKFDRQTLIKIYDEILLIYMSKNVTNIFKTTLIQLVQQRLKFKDDLIVRYVDYLLELEGLNFFKVVESSKKIKVVQINKQKFKQGKVLLQGMCFD